MMSSEQLHEVPGNPVKVDGDKVYVYDGRWRLVGRIGTDTLVCRRSEELHCWRAGLPDYDLARDQRKRHWGIDRRVVGLLVALGLTHIRYIGDEATYTASIDTFYQKGQAKDFGHGVQLFLRETHFDVVSHDEPVQESLLA